MMHPAILREEPKRTVATASFAGLAMLAPPGLFAWLKRVVFNRLSRGKARRGDSTPMVVASLG
jgi:hypothetical protein